MKIIEKIKKLRKEINIYKTGGLKIGFVPTMGYLHEGHLSLIRAARKDCDKVIVSIFVNPTQFGTGEDFEKYPRDLKNDSFLARKEGADVLFVPDASDMYPEKETTHVDVGELGDNLCGKYRPGHFRGVVTVVAKFFNLVRPDIAYFGQKDYQQAVIIKKMVEDLNLPVQIKVMPIVREKDGLAMSSRNSYLTPEQRQAATVIFQALKAARTAVKNGENDASKVLSIAKAELDNELLCKPQYLEIIDPVNLQPVKQLGSPSLIIIAAYVGEVRLIDNVLIGP